MIFPLIATIEKISERLWSDKIWCVFADINHLPHIISMNCNGINLKSMGAKTSGLMQMKELLAQFGFYLELYA